MFRFHVPEVKPYLPDAIVDASLHANTYFPQRLTGTTVVAGHVATQMALTEKEHWHTLFWADLTDAQFARGVEVVERAHKAMGIPYKMKKGIEPVDRENQTFTPERLRLVVGDSFRPRLHRVMGDYAMNMFDMGTPDDSVDLFMENVSEEEADQRSILNSNAIGELFRPRSIFTWKRFHPAAHAFGGLMQAANDSLHRTRPEALAISKGISATYKAFFASAQEDEDFNASAVSLVGFDMDLHGLVRDEVYEKLPDIQQRAGINLPSAVVKRFVEWIAPLPEIWDEQ